MQPAPAAFSPCGEPARAMHNDPISATNSKRAELRRAAGVHGQHRTAPVMKGGITGRQSGSIRSPCMRSYNLSAAKLHTGATHASTSLARVSVGSVAAQPATGVHWHRGSAAAQIPVRMQADPNCKKSCPPAGTARQPLVLNGTRDRAAKQSAEVAAVDETDRETNTEQEQQTCNGGGRRGSMKLPASCHSAPMVGMRAVTHGVRGSAGPETCRMHVGAHRCCWWLQRADAAQRPDGRNAGRRNEEDVGALARGGGAHLAT